MITAAGTIQEAHFYYQGGKPKSLRGVTAFTVPWGAWLLLLPALALRSQQVNAFNLGMIPRRKIYSSSSSISYTSSAPPEFSSFNTLNRLSACRRTRKHVAPCGSGPISSCWELGMVDGPDDYYDDFSGYNESGIGGGGDDVSSVSSNSDCEADFCEEDFGDSGVVMEDLAWRIEKLRLEEANTRRFLKAKPVFLPYKECRKWVQAFGRRWKTAEEWQKWISMGEKRNSYIPSRPDEYYRRTGDWISWDHFLLEADNEDNGD